MASNRSPIGRIDHGCSVSDGQPRERSTTKQINDNQVSSFCALHGVVSVHEAYGPLDDRRVVFSVGHLGGRRPRSRHVRLVLSKQAQPDFSRLAAPQPLPLGKQAETEGQGAVARQLKGNRSGGGQKTGSEYPILGDFFMCLRATGIASSILVVFGALLFFEFLAARLSVFEFPVVFWSVSFFGYTLSSV